MFCFVFVLFGRFDSCFSRFFETLEPEKLKPTLVKTHEGSAMNQKRKSKCLEAEGHRRLKPGGLTEDKPAAWGHVTAAQSHNKLHHLTDDFCVAH